MEVDPVFEFGGMTAFWRIVDVLQADGEPPKHQWDELLDSPGYVALSTEYKPGFFKEKYRLAYRPSSEAARERAVNMGDWYVKHYVDVAERRRELEAWVTSLGEKEGFMETHLMKAEEWLPSGVEGGLTVAFVVFDMDSRGYETVVIDPLFALSLGADFGGLLAHELFHSLARRFYVYDPEKVEANDGDIMWVLRQLNEEGIADQIYAMGYPSRDEHVADSPWVIQEMDRLIRRIAIAEDAGELSSMFRVTPPRAGHATGHYMANAILEALGKERLLDTVGDPFGFIRAYDEAAKTRGLKSFSQETLGYIDGLAMKYGGDG
jgi:hypothetical protein